MLFVALSSLLTEISLKFFLEDYGSKNIYLQSKKNMTQYLVAAFNSSLPNSL
jgi:hypothetical protein